MKQRQTSSWPLIVLVTGVAVCLFWQVTASNLSIGALVILVALAMAVLASPWRYLTAVLVLWVVTPEIRRLIDWQMGYGSISALSALPLATLLVPGFALFAGGWFRVPLPLLGLAWLWIAGLAYGLAVGLASDLGPAALYAFAQFGLPALLGLWLVSWSAPAARVHDRLAALLLGIATLVSLYGIYQYVALPPWDSEWMINSGMGAPIGKPEPFGLRVFSVLNSPAPCAGFLVLTLLFNLPRLQTGRPGLLLQGSLCLAALSLTFVRSAWIGLIAGLVLYLLLSPGRMRLLKPGLALAGVVGLLAFAVPALMGGDLVSQQVQARVESLGNLPNDISFNERRVLLEQQIARFGLQPQGNGLGSTGTATKLNRPLNEWQVLHVDNGYLARLIEMGLPGVLCYLATLAGGLLLVMDRWRTRRGGEAALTAAVAASQVALLLLDIAGDSHSALLGLFFWLGLGLVELPESSPCSVPCSTP